DERGAGAPRAGEEARHEAYRSRVARGEPEGRGVEAAARRDAVRHAPERDRAVVQDYPATVGAWRREHGLPVPPVDVPVGGDASDEHETLRPPERVGTADHVDPPPPHH